MKYLIIDLIFNNITKFPQPNTTSLPISGIRYQVIDNKVHKTKHISVIGSNILDNGIDTIEIVESETDLIKHVNYIISGNSVIGDAFVIDWTGFDYRYLCARSLMLSLELPYSTGHLAIGVIYKDKYPDTKSMNMRNIHEKTKLVVPTDEFGVFKFNIMRLLLNEYANFMNMTNNHLTNGEAYG